MHATISWDMTWPDWFHTSHKLGPSMSMTYQTEEKSGEPQHMSQNRRGLFPRTYHDVVVALSPFVVDLGDAMHPTQRAACKEKLEFRTAHYMADRPKLFIGLSATHL